MDWNKNDKPRVVKVKIDGTWRSWEVGYHTSIPSYKANRDIPPAMKSNDIDQLGYLLRQK